MLFQLLINGLIAGSVYGLIALGYSMVYGVLKFINFAHGEIFMVGAYLFYVFAIQLKMDFLPAMMVATSLTVLLGISIERIAYRPLRKASRLAPLISSIGISTALRALIIIIFGTRLISIRQDTKIIEGFHFWGATITPIQITIFIISVLLMLGVYIALHKTVIGKAIRTTAEDREAAEVVGIDTDKAIMATFGMGSGIAAIAGFLVGFDQGIEPTMGIIAGFKGFTASVLGGIGSTTGAVLGGYLLGIIENLGDGYISTGFKDAFAFLVLILVLVIKPRGLLGKAGRGM